MIIHFLHMEPSNPPTYYTYLYIDICRLHQSNKSTLFTRSCLTRLLSSRTQHRLTLSCQYIPLTTHEGVITSRALLTTLSTNRSVYISCRPPKLIPNIYNASARSLQAYSPVYSYSLSVCHIWWRSNGRLTCKRPILIFRYFWCQKCVPC